MVGSEPDLGAAVTVELPTVSTFRQLLHFAKWVAKLLMLVEAIETVNLSEDQQCRSSGGTIKSNKPSSPMYD